MSKDNVALVRSIYEAFAAGDVPTALRAMSPQMVWNEAENFPYADGNPYVGHDAIVAGVFMRLATEWDGFAAVPEEILDAGDTVVVLGRYQGAYKATGKAMRGPDGPCLVDRECQAVRFQQYVDTLQVAKATGRLILEAVRSRARKPQLLRTGGFHFNRAGGERGP